MLWATWSAKCEPRVSESSTVRILLLSEAEEVQSPQNQDNQLLAFDQFQTIWAQSSQIWAQFDILKPNTNQQILSREWDVIKEEKTWNSKINFLKLKENILVYHHKY